MLYVYYTGQAPDLPAALIRDGQVQTDRIFPAFMVAELPSGVRGLMVAAVIAAAMSTLSSSLTASSSTTLADFYLPATGGRRPAGHYLAVARRATVAWGVAQVVVALAAISVSQRIVDEVLGISSFTNGLILGVFLLVLPAIAGTRPRMRGWRAVPPSCSAIRLFTNVSWQLVRSDRRRHHPRGGLDGGPDGRPEGGAGWIGRRRSPRWRGSSTTRSAAAPFPAPPSRSAAAPDRSGAMPPAPSPTTAGTAATLDTVFDLASLTKVLATSTILMRLVDAQAIALADRVAGWLTDWRGSDRERVTIADLLEHAGGLTAHLPFFRGPPRARRLSARNLHAAPGIPAAEPVPLQRPGVHPARVHRRRRGGRRRGRAVRRDRGPAPDRRSALSPPRGVAVADRADRGRPVAGPLAPRRGARRQNGWALGGVAGHAGLFGTAPAVGGFARAVLETLEGRPRLARPETFARFAQRTRVPGSSRALGWDTMLVTSSCGRSLSPAAFGHTGFTGTSLWIDPVQNLYVVLLTNRVHPTRDNEAILGVRPAVHDAVVHALGRGNRAA